MASQETVTTTETGETGTEVYQYPHLNPMQAMNRRHFSLAEKSGIGSGRVVTSIPNGFQVARELPDGGERVTRYEYQHIPS